MPSVAAIAFVAAAATWRCGLAAGSWGNLTRDAAVAPSARDSHAMAAFGSTVFLFGGWTGEDFCLDLWRFGTATGNWSQVSAGAGPGARMHHAMAAVEVDQSIILFGGATFDLQPKYGDTWRYASDSNTWTPLTPATSPAARYNHQMVTVASDGAIILFGGQGAKTSHLGDTWRFDLANSSWRQVALQGTGPSARWGHGLGASDSAHAVFLFGGGSRREYLGDTWRYSVTGDTWTQVATKGAGPGVRWGHSMACLDSAGACLVFGGQRVVNASFVVLLNDTWRYDIDADTWTEVTFSPGSAPPAREWHAAAAVSRGSGLVLIFGGEGDVSDELADTWALDLGATTSATTTTTPPTPPTTTSTTTETDTSTTTTTFVPAPVGPGGTHKFALIWAAVIGGVVILTALVAGIASVRRRWLAQHNVLGQQLIQLPGGR